MKNILNRLSLYFETVPARLRRRKIWVWLFFVSMTVLMVIGTTKTKFDMTLESWFSDDDPIKVALDNFHAEFGSDDGIYIVYEPADGDVFSEKSLRLIKGIREELLNFRRRVKNPQESMLNHITRINTLVNAIVLTTNRDTLVSSHLVGDPIPTSREELEAIRGKAVSQRSFPLLYFSRDYKFGGMFIETDFGTIPFDANDTGVGNGVDNGLDEGFGEELEVGDMALTTDGGVSKERVTFKPTDMSSYLGLMREINQVIKKEPYASHFKYYLVGNAPLMEFGVKVMEEMGPMSIGMIVIMVFMFWILFRSFSAVLWPILIVVLSAVWTVGIVGWMGVTITTMLMLTIMLILAVGTADAIHILSGYLFFRKRGQNHETAIASAFQKSGLACLLTSLTTMVGMLSLVFTDMVHIRVFGYTSALGVGLAFLLTVYFLPVMLDLWSPVPKKESTREKRRTFSFHLLPDISTVLQKLLSQILPVVQKGPVFISLMFLSIFGICVYGASTVIVDSNIIEQFKEGSGIRETYKIVDSNMMGTQNMIIFVDMGKEYAFQDPTVILAMDKLQQTMESEYDQLVVKTSSLADVIKNAYQTLNEGKDEMYIIPRDRKVLSQTLFLFNNANPEDRRKLVSDDYSKSHVTAQLYNSGSNEYIKTFKNMRRDIDEILNPLRRRYPKMEVTITGGLPLMMELSDYITWSQIRSLSLVILLISIMLVFVFGSLRAGLISIIPNLIPATITFGLLGLLGIPLDSDTMIIAPVIIGIAVDDTIHFITHYRSEVLIDGDIARALQDTLAEVGQAMTFTTLILGLGFSIMSFSTHVGMSNLGRFGTLAILVALLCDLFMLPAIILIFKPRFLKKGARRVNPASAISHKRE